MPCFKNHFHASVCSPRRPEIISSMIYDWENIGLYGPTTIQQGKKVKVFICTCRLFHTYSKELYNFILILKSFVKYVYRLSSSRAHLEPCVPRKEYIILLF